MKEATIRWVRVMEEGTYDLFPSNALERRPKASAEWSVRLYLTVTPLQGSRASVASEFHCTFPTRVRFPDEPTFHKTVQASAVVVTYAGSPLARGLFLVNIALSIDLPLIIYTSFTKGSNVV